MIIALDFLTSVLDDQQNRLDISVCILVLSNFITLYFGDEIIRWGECLCLCLCLCSFYCIVWFGVLGRFTYWNLDTFISTNTNNLCQMFSVILYLMWVISWKRGDYLEFQNVLLLGELRLQKTYQIHFQNKQEERLWTYEKPPNSRITYIN